MTDKVVGLACSETGVESAIPTCERVFVVDAAMRGGPELGLRRLCARQFCSDGFLIDDHEDCRTQHSDRQPLDRAGAARDAAPDHRRTLEHPQHQERTPGGARNAGAAACDRAESDRSHGRGRTPAARRGGARAQSSVPPHPLHPGRRGDREGRRNRQGGDRAAGQPRTVAGAARDRPRRHAGGGDELHLRPDWIRSARGRCARGQPQVQGRPELRALEGVLQRRRLR